MSLELVKTSRRSNQGSSDEWILLSLNFTLLNGKNARNDSRSPGLISTKLSVNVRFFPWQHLYLLLYLK